MYAKLHWAPSHSLLHKLIAMLTICRHHTTFDVAAHVTPVCPLSCKNQSGMLCFVLCKSLKRCALLSKKVCFTLKKGEFYFLKRCTLLSKKACFTFQKRVPFVACNHSRGPVLDDFLYNAPYVLIVSRRV